MRWQTRSLLSNSERFKITYVCRVDGLSENFSTLIEPRPTSQQLGMDLYFVLREFESDV